MYGAEAGPDEEQDRSHGQGDEQDFAEGGTERARDRCHHASAVEAAGPDEVEDVHEREPVCDAGEHGDAGREVGR